MCPTLQLRPARDVLHLSFSRLRNKLNNYNVSVNVVQELMIIVLYSIRNCDHTALLQLLAAAVAVPRRPTDALR